MPTVTYKRMEYSRCSAIPAQERGIFIWSGVVHRLRSNVCVCWGGGTVAVVGGNKGERSREALQSKCGCNCKSCNWIHMQKRKLQIIPRPVKRSSGNDETDPLAVADWAMGCYPLPVKGLMVTMRVTFICWLWKCLHYLLSLFSLLYRIPKRYWQHQTHKICFSQFPRLVNSESRH